METSGNSLNSGIMATNNTVVASHSSCSPFGSLQYLSLPLAEDQSLGRSCRPMFQVYGEILNAHVQVVEKQV